MNDDSDDENVKWTVKGYVIGVVLVLLQACCGIAAYVVLTGLIVAVPLKQPVFSIYIPIIITLSQLVGTFISVPLLQTMKLKFLTLAGGFSLALFNVLIGMFLTFFQKYNNFKNFGLTLVVLTIFSFLFCFGATLSATIGASLRYMMPPGAIMAGNVLHLIFVGITIIILFIDINTSIWVFSGLTLFFSILCALLMV